MILSPEIVRQIQGHKRQMVRIPRNRANCRYRPGHAYQVKTSRITKPACEITIESVREAWLSDAEQMDRDQPVWEIRFKLGNHTDEDRYPAAQVGGTGGDYTSIPSRKLTGTGAEVSAHELSRFVAMRDEKEPDRLADQKRRVDAALTEIRKHGRNPAINEQLRRAQDRIRTIRVPKRYDPPSASEQSGVEAGSAQSGAEA